MKLIYNLGTKIIFWQKKKKLLPKIGRQKINKRKKKLETKSIIWDV